MGGDDFSQSYRDQLEREIDESYEHYRSHNESKNIFKAANTPITLGAVSMILYVFSQIFALVGITPLAGIVNLAMMVTFALLAVWAYTKYTGKAPELGTSIDQFAVTVWDSGLQPVFNRLAEEGSQYATRKAMQRLNSVQQSPETKKRN